MRQWQLTHYDETLRREEYLYIYQCLEGLEGFRLPHPHSCKYCDNQKFQIPTLVYLQLYKNHLCN